MLQVADIYPRVYVPNVKTGAIIVFPGFLEHMVSPNSDQNTISGNLIFKPINKGDKKNAIRNSN